MNHAIDLFKKLAYERALRQRELTLRFICWCIIGGTMIFAIRCYLGGLK